MKLKIKNLTTIFVLILLLTSYSKSDGTTPLSEMQNFLRFKLDGVQHEMVMLICQYDKIKRNLVISATDMTKTRIFSIEVENMDLKTNNVYNLLNHKGIMYSILNI